MSPILATFGLLGYLYSITILAAFALIGAGNAVDPQTVTVWLLITTLVNILAFVSMVTGLHNARMKDQNEEKHKLKDMLVVAPPDKR
jgi:hypothetical protein